VAKVSVPLAVEASVLLFNNSELSSLNVSEKSLAGILDGSIQNWADLQIDNPGSVVSKKTIKLVSKTNPEAMDAVTAFLKAKKLKTGNNSKLESDKNVSIDTYASMEDGSMAIVPNSYAVSLGLYPASIYLGLDSDGNSILGNPDVNGIQSGASQWDFKASKYGFKVALNYTKEPSVPQGFDTAPTPYQIVYPVNLYLCKDTLLNRAVSRFVLRLDSQGALGLSNYAQIPEVVRVSALLSVSEGLPTPTPTPTE
jgi:ABC-type phosphate transport system substrate-binding protein